METVLVLLLFCALIAMVVGMFAPRLVLPAKLRPGRIKVLGVYVLAIVAIGSIGAALESPEKRAERNAKLAEEKRIEQEKTRAEQEKTRAEQEKTRAEQEKKRAEQEAKVAEEKRIEAERRASPEYQKGKAIAQIKRADNTIKDAEVVGEVLHVTIDPGMTWSTATYIRDMTRPMLKAMEVAKDYPAAANYIRFNGNTDLTDSYGKTRNETVIRLQATMVDAQQINYDKVNNRQFLNLIQVISEQRQLGLSREYCREYAEDSRVFCAKALSR